jgi:hypothetical protein
MPPAFPGYGVFRAGGILSNWGRLMSEVFSAIYAAIQR